MAYVGITVLELAGEDVKIRALEPAPTPAQEPVQVHALALVLPSVLTIARVDVDGHAQELAMPNA